MSEPEMLLGIAKRLHHLLSAAGTNIASFTLIGLVLHLLPFAALCGSIYLGAILVDHLGLGWVGGIPVLALWFLFVCVYVADHVQPRVADAATKLGRE